MTNKTRTAFATHRGLFQYKVMLLGPCNSPATFERLMELVLSGVLFERCLAVYIDDVPCFGKTEEEALYNLRKQHLGRKRLNSEISHVYFNVSGPLSPLPITNNSLQLFYSQSITRPSIADRINV